MSETPTTTSEAAPSIEWVHSFAQQWLDAWNSHEVDRLLALMTDDIEYRDDAWPRPMHTGVLDPPGFAPTGRRWELDGFDLHEYRDGRVSKLRIVFDVFSASRQLGLMPAAGSRTEKAMALAQRSAARVQQAIRDRRG
jgi:hypothetical protein